MPKILVFTPTYEGLLRPETVASVKAQQFDGILDYEVRDENPYPGRDMRNVLAHYQWARDKAIQGGYDGLVTVEHDMRIPPNAIQLLWDMGAQVVYGVYVLRHGTGVLNAWRYEGDINLGMSLSIHPKDLEQATKQVVARVSGIGNGCTLVRMPTLKAIPYRGTDSGGVDMPFAVDCLHKGIESYARFDVPCDHYHEGSWLTVAGNGDPIARVLAKDNVNITIDGQSTPLRKGKYYSMAVSDALEHQRAGYVQITNEAGEGRETATDSAVEKRETATKPAAKRRRKRAS